MAYFDRDISFLVWLAEPLPDDVLSQSSIHLMESEPEPTAHVTDPEASCGFIVRDWFGPFLLSPASRGLRGRC